MKKNYFFSHNVNHFKSKVILSGLMLGLLSTYTAKAIFVSVPVTGYTADVVANGIGLPQTSTDSTADAAGWYFLDSTYRNISGGIAPLHALSPSGTIHSLVTPNLIFQMASFTGANSLRLSSTGVAGALTFPTPMTATDVYILATTGSGAGVVTITVNFTDATFQSFVNIAVPDWFGGTGFAIQGIGRVNPLNSQPTGTGAATDPKLYERKVTLSAGNQSKLISGITVTRTSALGVVNVMGVTVAQGPNSIANFESSTTSLIKVYPNPASGDFYLELKTPVLTAENSTVSIYNSSGEKVYSTQVNKASFDKITISPEKTLTPGVYVLEAIVNNKSYRERVVMK